MHHKPTIWQHVRGTSEADNLDGVLCAARKERLHVGKLVAILGARKESSARNIAEKPIKYV